MMLAPLSPGAFRTCEEIAVFRPVRTISVPHLRRSIFGPSEPRAYARGYGRRTESRPERPAHLALRFVHGFFAHPGLLSAAPAGADRLFETEPRRGGRE